MLTVAFLLTPAIASAQQLGCYIQAPFLSIYNLYGLCAVNAYPSCGSSHANNFAAFGSALASTCDECNATTDSLVQCNTSLNKVIDDYNKLVAKSNNCIDQYQAKFSDWSACGETVNQINGAIGYWKGLAEYWNGLYGRQLTTQSQTGDLVARLRARCGTKCRSIQ